MVLLAERRPSATKADALTQLQHFSGQLQPTGAAWFVDVDAGVILGWLRFGSRLSLWPDGDEGFAPVYDADFYRCVACDLFDLLTIGVVQHDEAIVCRDR